MQRPLGIFPPRMQCLQLGWPNPQTSGGLLIACNPSCATEITRTITETGYQRARASSDTPTPAIDNHDYAMTCRALR
jgi:hypothetical protein